MRLIVHPNYRWLNLLLAAAHTLFSLWQVFQALQGVAVEFHALVAIMYGFLAFGLIRVVPWVYVAVAGMNLIGIVAILNSLASWGGYGFFAIAIAGATAWCAVFLRGQLLIPVSHEKS